MSAEQPYTPSLEVGRAVWAAALFEGLVVGRSLVDAEGDEERAGAQFDRMIAQVRAETLREAVEHINSNGMISRRNLEPYWEGWDDATERAAQEVEALIEKEQSE